MLITETKKEDRIICYSSRKNSKRYIELTCHNCGKKFAKEEKINLFPDDLLKLGNLCIKTYNDLMAKDIKSTTVPAKDSLDDNIPF